MGRSIFGWCVLLVVLVVWGCAGIGPSRDFRFVPVTEETYPEAQEAKIYRQGVGRPHRVLGEVTVFGRPGKTGDALEERLLEVTRKLGGQGVIVIETNQRVQEVGTAGVRYDSVGGAATEYRIYPSPLVIEEEQIYVRGIAIRFIED